jgi:hypothetical protein
LLLAEKRAAHDGRLRGTDVRVTYQYHVDGAQAVIRHVAEVLPTVPRTVTLARDPDDEPYLNLAVASGAAYLVTRDRDMLDLMKDAAFVAQYPDLKILSPVELLKELTPPIALQEEEPRERKLEP